MSPPTEIHRARTYREAAPRSSRLGPSAMRAGLRGLYLRTAGCARRFSEPSFVRCLYLHYVYDDQVDAFRHLLTELGRVGAFVSTDQLHRWLTERDGLPPGRYFHLSFDDGFDNVYRNAFPILSELGIPATAFVPTRFIDGKDEQLILDWSSTTRVSAPTRPMSWSQLDEMSRHGVEIGAHTRRHTRLSEISDKPDRLVDEVRGSKRDIEDALGRPCRFMSWPYGTRADVDDRSMEAIESCGYELSFSAVRGTVRRGDTSPLSVPRHHFEPEWPWSHVRYFSAGGGERT